MSSLQIVATVVSSYITSWTVGDPTYVPVTGAQDGAAIDSWQNSAGTARGYRCSPPRIPLLPTMPTITPEVRTQLLSREPLVARLDNVFTKEQCAALCALGEQYAAPANLLPPFSGLAPLWRDGKTALFREPAKHEDVMRMANLRMAEVGHFANENAEPISLNCYAPGQKFARHFDWLPKMDTTLEAYGQRVATLLVYLQEPVLGGETYFPAIGLRVTPKIGSALYFEYANDAAEVDFRTLHEGLPVKQGTKWFAQRLIRDRPWRAWIAMDTQKYSQSLTR